MNAVKTPIEIRVGDALVRPIMRFSELPLPRPVPTTGAFTVGGRHLEESLRELDADIKRAREELSRVSRT